MMRIVGLLISFNIFLGPMRIVERACYTMPRFSSQEQKISRLIWLAPGTFECRLNTSSPHHFLANTQLFTHKAFMTSAGDF